MCTVYAIKKLFMGGACVKSTLDIRGTVVENLKLASRKSHAQLLKIYMIVSYIIRKICRNCVVLNNLQRASTQIDEREKHA